jgi:hypothetical protein
VGKPVDLEADGTVIWEDEDTGERWTEGLPPTRSEYVEILARKTSEAADARAALVRPLVIAWVEGGIGYTKVIRGDVEVLEWDWDNIEAAEDPAVIEEYIANAEALPDDYPEKDGILNSMRRALNNLTEAMGDDDTLLTVKVVLLNNDGDREVEYGTGKTNDEAVHAAEEAVRIRTGDDSYVMTDWSAA